MVSAAEVAAALRGIDFPATRRQCVDHARKQNASKKVLDILKRMPDKPYESMADVFKAIGQLELVH